MALTSALFTGLSGLDVNQTKLNIVGNNIANVNTVAFKASRALFKPQFYVTDTAGTPASADFGGQNPSQRGLGAQVSAIQKDYTPGQIEPTGRSTDLAIDGDGFFIIDGKEQQFTRDGSFSLNSQNTLVNIDGGFVQGFSVDEDGNIIQGTLGNLEIPLGAQTIARATTTAGFLGNLNSSGPKATGASILQSGPLTDVGGGATGARVSDTTLLVDLRELDDTNTPGATQLFSDGDTLTLSGRRGGRDLPDLAYTITATSTVAELQQFFNQGMIIDTGVTGPAGFATAGTSVVDDPDLSVGSRLQIIGNAGSGNALSISGTGFSSSNAAMGITFSDTVDSNPAGESIFTSLPVYDSLGNELTVNVTAVLADKTDAGTTWRFYATSPDDTEFQAEFTPSATPPDGQVIGTGLLQFDNDGKLLTGAQPTIKINRVATGAGSPLNVTLDFSQMTALADTQSSLLSSEQDGVKIGVLDGFSIGANGVITGTFTNGLTRSLGQVALASFDNNSGLIDKGGNMYTTGPDSGSPKITTPQQLSSGSIRAGALESSNVDLSDEFINMIIASTGFSAASRVISTSDQLLTELLQTTR
jgi:flagellar hook protein FlgE